MFKQIFLLRKTMRNILFYEYQNNMCTSSAKLSNSKEAKILMKIMHGTKNPKKRHIFAETSSSSLPHFDPDVRKNLRLGKGTSGRISNKRQNVLNHLFSQHITEHMYSNDAILGKNIQVTKVIVSPDFKFVKVYWMSDLIQSKQDFTLKELLDKYSNTLRHSLSTAGVIGNVPPIIFVPDKELALAKEVEQLLQTVDLGCDEDDLEDVININSENFENSLQLGNEKQKDDDELPPMRHDVFGVNYSDIMTRIKKSSKKINEKIDPIENIDEVKNFIRKASEDDRENILKSFRKERKQKHTRVTYNDYVKKYEIESNDQVDEEEDYIDESTDDFHHHR